MAAAALLVALVAAASQTDIVGSTGSGSFGTSVTVLANGNIVVTDPYYDADSVTDVGAAYLYDGATGALISMLTGSTINDRVGSGGVTALANGNYVVLSPNWDSGAVTNAGAATWGSGMIGVTGTVSVTNSLVGGTAGDRIGIGGATALTNGNYVVRSQYWNNGTVANAGAVTWGSGTTGVTGTVSATNSLVGSTADDQIGSSGVTELANGSYVVHSQYWDNGAAMDAGAVTWGSGTAGVTGVVSATNSLVGSTANDRIGDVDVTVLVNGNYVVHGRYWDNGAAVDAGAATWGSGTAGAAGVISATNSLVGSTANDLIGSAGVTPLANGSYVVLSPYWDDGAVANVGAATWGSGTTGVTGTISAANSLMGSTANDWVGYGGATALTNGNYVVRSYYWNNGAATEAGAATWGSGTAGITGTISAANSLVGSTTNDWVSNGDVTALTNGNYVVCSSNWDDGVVANVGAATWGSGMTGITGTVSAANSLVGSTAGDQVGNSGATALANGSYVVRSPYWDNGVTVDAGAATWGSGTAGVTGTVSAANSLVGSTANDLISSPGVMVLANGNYVVRSRYWDNGTLVDAGAATWGSGATGVTGTVSAANSLVGSATNERVGNSVTKLTNGNYAVVISGWDGAAANAGAVTWGSGATGVTGTVSAANSLVGTTAGDRVGGGGVRALANGNYVVISIDWDDGTVANVGAVTWGSGTMGIVGTVSTSNSLVGGTVDDRIGDGGVTVLANGNYVVRSTIWDNGATTDAGAITLGDGIAGNTTGPVTTDNSVRGTVASGGGSLNFVHDDVNGKLIVGRPAENIVTLFRPDRPPVASVGPDQTVWIMSPVTLDGSTSYDPDGNLPLAFGWTQSDGTPVVLSSAVISRPTFTAPAVASQTATLTFRLTVTNSLGLSSPPARVVITVESHRVLLPMAIR